MNLAMYKLFLKANQIDLTWPNKIYRNHIIDKQRYPYIPSMILVEIVKLIVDKHRTFHLSWDLKIMELIHLRKRKMLPWHTKERQEIREIPKFFQHIKNIISSYKQGIELTIKLRVQVLSMSPFWMYSTISLE